MTLFNIAAIAAASMLTLATAGGAALAQSTGGNNGGGHSGGPSGEGNGPIPDLFQTFKKTDCPGGSCKLPAQVPMTTYPRRIELPQGQFDCDEFLRRAHGWTAEYWSARYRECKRRIEDG